MLSSSLDRQRRRRRASSPLLLLLVLVLALLLSCCCSVADSKHDGGKQHEVEAGAVPLPVLPLSAAAAAAAGPVDGSAAATGSRHKTAGAGTVRSNSAASDARAAREAAREAARAFANGATRTAGDAATLASYLQDPMVRTILLSNDIILNDANWAAIGSAVVMRRVTVAPTPAALANFSSAGNPAEGRVTVDFGRLVSAVVLAGDKARLTLDHVWLRGLAPRGGVRAEGLTRLRPSGLSAWPSVVTLPNTTLALVDARVDYVAEDGWGGNCSQFGARVKAETDALGYEARLSDAGRDLTLPGTNVVVQTLRSPADGDAAVGNCTVVSTDTVVSCVPAPARPGKMPSKRVALPPVAAAGGPAPAEAVGGSSGGGAGRGDLVNISSAPGDDGSAAPPPPGGASSPGASLSGAASAAASAVAALANRIRGQGGSGNGSSSYQRPRSKLHWWAWLIIGIACSVILVLLIGVAVLSRRLRRLQRRRSLARSMSSKDKASAAVAAAAARAVAKAGGSNTKTNAAVADDGGESGLAALSTAPSSSSPAGSNNKDNGKEKGRSARNPADLPLLLRARSTDAVGDIELGPLLGRGSFGRVYKARWKSTIVAIKVIDAEDAARGGGGGGAGDASVAAGAAAAAAGSSSNASAAARARQDDAARESALALAVQHPNVVATYKVLTVAAGGSSRPAESVAAAASAANAAAAAAARAASSTAGSDSDDDKLSSSAAGASSPASTAVVPLETWIVLEFCDRGTLDAAVRGGRFYSKQRLLQQQSAGAESAAALQSAAAGGGSAGSPEAKGNKSGAGALVATSSLPSSSPSLLPSSSPPSTKNTAINGIAPRDVASIWACLKDVAAGLDYLHALGVMHGDLKPANVLLKSTASDPRGFSCKVSDFGLSRVLDAGSTHVSTRSYGTIAFMPPELIRDGRLARSADAYAFGILMWELWAGSSAYEGVPTATVFYRVAIEGGRPGPLPGQEEFGGWKESCSAKKKQKKKPATTTKAKEDKEEGEEEEEEEPPYAPPPAEVAAGRAPPAEYVSLMRECWADDEASRPTFDEILRRVTPLATAAREAARARAKALGGGGGGGGSGGAGGGGAGGGGDGSSGRPPNNGGGGSTSAAPPPAPNTASPLGSAFAGAAAAGAGFVAPGAAAAAGGAKPDAGGATAVATLAGGSCGKPPLAPATSASLELARKTVTFANQAPAPPRG